MSAAEREKQLARREGFVAGLEEFARENCGWAGRDSLAVLRVGGKSPEEYAARKYPLPTVTMPPMSEAAKLATVFRAAAKGPYEARQHGGHMTTLSMLEAQEGAFNAIADVFEKVAEAESQTLFTKRDVAVLDDLIGNCGIRYDAAEALRDKVAALSPWASDSGVPERFRSHGVRSTESSSEPLAKSREVL